MIAALILAGGAGQRLGGVDKAFVRLGGETLIAHVAGRLAARLPRSACIGISANGDASRFAGFGLAVLADGPHAGIGPLAGILAGLGWAQALGAGSLLTLPVDTPFFPDDLLDRLGPAPAVAMWRGRQHHLVSHWPVAARADLTALAAGDPPHRIRDALARIGARPVTFEGEADPFHNINTPEDLAVAVRRLAASPD